MAIKVGDNVKFKGYSQLEDGQEPILSDGETVRVIKYDEADELYTVSSVQDPEKVDSAFAEEIEELPAQQEADAAAATAAEKSKRTRRAAAAATETAPAAEPEVTENEESDEGNEEVPAEEAPSEEEAPTTKKRGRKPKAQAAVEAPATTPASAPKMVVLDTIKDMVGSMETALKSAKDVAATLSNLREQEEQTVFTLGGLLSYIKNAEGFKTLGYEDMAAYSERELGLKKRSAEYYVRIYNELTEAGVTTKQIEGIGWTKLRSLIGAITADNKADLLKKARAMSRDDLEEHMKTVRANVGKSTPSVDTPTMVKFPAFKLFKDRADSLTALIEQAKSTYNVDNMADALFFMATDWAQGQNADVPAEAALATFNARYGTDFDMSEFEDPATDEAQQDATA